MRRLQKQSLVLKREQRKAAIADSGSEDAGSDGDDEEAVYDPLAMLDGKTPAAGGDDDEEESSGDEDDDEQTTSKGDGCCVSVGLAGRLWLVRARPPRDVPAPAFLLPRPSSPRRVRPGLPPLAPRLDLAMAIPTACSAACSERCLPAPGRATSGAGAHHPGDA